MDQEVETTGAENLARKEPASHNYYSCPQHSELVEGHIHICNQEAPSPFWAFSHS
jgi:hypothetical protein